MRGGASLILPQAHPAAHAVRIMPSASYAPPRPRCPPRFYVIMGLQIASNLALVCSMTLLYTDVKNIFQLNATRLQFPVLSTGGRVCMLLHLVARTPETPRSWLVQA